MWTLISKWKKTTTKWSPLILRVESPLRIPPKKSSPHDPFKTRLQENSRKASEHLRGFLLRKSSIVFPWVSMDKQTNPQSSTGYFLCIRYIQSWKSYCCYFCSRLQHLTKVVPDETCNFPSVIRWGLSLVIISTRISRTLFHWGVLE